MPKSFSPMLSSKICIVLHFTFGSVIHFVLIFIKGVRSLSRFIYVFIGSFSTIALFFVVVVFFCFVLFFEKADLP